MNKYRDIRGDYVNITQMEQTILDKEWTCFGELIGAQLGLEIEGRRIFNQCLTAVIADHITQLHNSSLNEVRNKGFIELSGGEVSRIRKISEMKSTNKDLCWLVELLTNKFNIELDQKPVQKYEELVTANNEPAPVEIYGEGDTALVPPDVDGEVIHIVNEDGKPVIIDNEAKPEGDPLTSGPMAKRLSFAEKMEAARRPAGL